MREELSALGVRDSFRQRELDKLRDVGTAHDELRLAKTSVEVPTVIVPTLTPRPPSSLGISPISPLSDIQSEVSAMMVSVSEGIALKFPMPSTAPSDIGPSASQVAAPTGLPLYHLATGVTQLAAAAVTTVASGCGCASGSGGAMPPRPPPSSSSNAPARHPGGGGGGGPPSSGGGGGGGGDGGSVPLESIDVGHSP